MSRMTMIGVAAAVAVLAIGGLTAFLTFNGPGDGPRRLSEDPVVAAGLIATDENCTVCHALYRDDPFRVGPSLWEIVGAEKARMDGYAYSQALANAEGRWTEAELDAFLADPHGFMPGTRMTFSGLASPETRREIIVFLSTLED
ncbi:MAG: hypothetical protein GVY13_05795 [Alphaproteobacteria bacterium]|nr:hypothetical protein [Alphaproteobacteria bacterium]